MLSGSRASSAWPRGAGLHDENRPERLGKSRTSVTASMGLNSMPTAVHRPCRLADISFKSLLLQEPTFALSAP